MNTSRPKRKLSVLVAMATMIGGLLMAASAPAHATPPPSFFNYNTGRCLDDSVYGLRSFPCNGLSYQTWTIGYDPFNPAVVTLHNNNTGRCIDDSVYGLRSFPCNGLSFQMWLPYPTTTTGSLAYTSFYFQNANTGRCIDDSGAYGLRSFPCNGLDYQIWGAFGYEGPPVIAPGEDCGVGTSCLNTMLPMMMQMMM